MISSEMPRPRLPHLQRETTRHGQAVWYVRVNRGPRIRIRGEYGSDEFSANYQAAISGERPEASKRAAKTGTLKWLIDRWKQSAEWAALKPATRKQRGNVLEHVIETAGSTPYAAIRKKHIREGMERRKNTPFAANDFLKTMRALFRWAVASELREDDPTESVSFFPARTDGFAPWTSEDVEKYRARWPLGTRARVAMEVLLHTGLRRGDAVTLGRQHVKDGIAHIKAEKTGVDLFLPILPDLQSALDAGPTGDLAFIVGENGEPLTKESFGNWFRECCRAAGVEKSAHGLRKLAASSVAERGATEHELQARFGWISNRQSQVYTRAADRKRLALQAAKRMEGEHPIPAPKPKRSRTFQKIQ